MNTLLKAKNLSAIPIKEPWIDLILDGIKNWEVRSKNTKKIGPVALIKSGSRTVVGIAILTKVIKITPSIAKANAKQMGMTVKGALTEVGKYAWVLEDVVPFKNPIPYKHPYGAVTWVTLDESTTIKIDKELDLSLR